LRTTFHTYLSTVHQRGDDPAAPLFPNRRRGGYTHGERGSKVADSEAHGALDWSEPVEPGAFKRNLFDRACIAANLGGVRLHDLRHTYASISLARRIDLREVSEQMGHATPSFTMDIYGGLTPADDDAASPMDARPQTALTMHTR
jgi:integrase